VSFVTKQIEVVLCSFLNGEVHSEAKQLTCKLDFFEKKNFLTCNRKLG